MNPINNAVRKIHNLLSSGSVTVTGPNQPRILKQKVGSTVMSTPTTNNTMLSSGSVFSGRCYICDENTTATQNQILTEMQTTHTSTKFPNKIGQLVGDAFMVIISVEDVVCQRCTNLINYLDRLENDVERVRNNIINLLQKKYGLNDDGNNTTAVSQMNATSSPPIKIQKLNTANSVINRLTTMNDDSSSDLNKTRKTAVLSDTIGKQSPPVSAVQQIKITTPVQQQQQQQQQIKKGGTKVYKCLSCDFKTTDLKQFNPHYETCKQQNFQCKICKKIFANLAAMKQHMAKEHTTAAQSASGTNEHTCSICHLNFTNDLALKKHTELNHSNVVLAETSQHTTPLYTCNNCQFKSTDKPLFDEHMRKHIGGKPKPFKCRLCSMRFETREQATIHAKQHQPNYFKCATCSMSFPKRELLAKHFEMHQHHQQQTQKQSVSTVQQQVIVQQQSQQQTSSPQIMTTQKLLQDTIDEALSESTGEGETTKSIRFFSCHICSLTFIQENYYNQHMETHKREKKTSSISTSTSGATNASTAVTQTLTATAQTISTNNQSLIRDTAGKQRHEAANILISASNVQHSNNTRGVSATNSTNAGAGICDADIESIFEKMHSDKSESDSGVAASNSGSRTSDNTSSVATGTNNSGDNLVITSQESSSGITFNITIPQPESSEQQRNGEGKSNLDRGTGATVSIDMPVLDQGDDSMTSSKKNGVTSSSSVKNQQNSISENSKNEDNIDRSTTALGPVSMPSLDDDNEVAQEEQQQQQSDDGSQKSQDTLKRESLDSQQITATSADSQQQNSGENSQQDQQNDQDDSAQQQQLAAAGDQVSMDLDDMQAGVEGGQIKFILNENGQLLQLDNHIITDAEGNQILVQGSDSEQIQQLLQSVGVLQSGDGLDGETLQMIGDNNGQMVLVQGEQGEAQLIDASLLNADGHIVIQQSHDGDLSEGGAHVIGEDGTRIPVSVSYTADGQPIVQVQQQHQPNSDDGGVEGGTDKTVSLGEVNPTTTDGETTPVTVSQSLAQSSESGYFALEDLMQQSDTVTKSTD